MIIQTVFRRRRRKVLPYRRPAYPSGYSLRAASHRQYDRTIRRPVTIILVAAVAVLGSLAFIRVARHPEELRVAKATADIREISAALHQYKIDNFVYPSTRQGLQALLARPAGDPLAPNWHHGGYIKKLPVDPWGRPYQYFDPGLHRRTQYDLFSLGADGERGGDGVNTDIGNWNLRK